MTSIEKRAAVVARIREHYASLGIPLDELSDRQIELGVRQLAVAAREAGMSQGDATEAMRKAVDSARRGGLDGDATPGEPPENPV